MKVLIVDDEQLQRELIKASVCWEKVGIKKVLEASDGREALFIFEKEQPEIIIMDINIPFINGIEVSRQMKAKAPEIQIIILTAYGEFDYAKDAIGFGAAAFVLKPLNPKELEEELEKASLVISNKWKNKKERWKMEKEQFLLENLSGISHEKHSEKWSIYQINQDKKMCILDIHFYNEDLQKKYAPVFEEYIIEQFPICESMTVDKDILLILFEEDGKEELLLKIHTLCRNLDEDMGKQKIAVGAFSGVHATVFELQIAYREAYGIMAKAVKEGRFYNYERQSLNAFIERISYRWEEFLYCLRSDDRNTLKEKLNKCFERLAEEGDNQAAVYIAVDILVNFTSDFMEYGMDISNELEEDYEMIKQLSYENKICEIGVLIEDILEKGRIVIQKHTKAPSGRKVEEAKKYIEKNYYISELSLNMVAEELKINPSYLSNIFKKEWGYSLSRYIIQVRMEKAAEYRRENPNATLAEAAEEVGYTDVYYFSKSFKNYYGVSPSKY